LVKFFFFGSPEVAPRKIHSKIKEIYVSATNLNHINFTKKTLESLSAPVSKDREYFHDTRVIGLVLMLTKKGVKSFQVYRKHNGIPIRVTLGKFPEMSVENARTQGQKVIAELLSGKNPNTEKRKIRKEITFGNAFENFMTRYSKPYKKSWKYDEREVSKFLSHWFNRKLASISKQEIQILHEKIKDESGLYQSNRILERIKAIYNKTIEWGWDGINPAQGVKKFKEKSRNRFLHPDELPKFFESVDMEQNDTIRDYIYVSLLTGARRSNVQAMKWEDVYLQRREWLIPETKNGEPLRIHLVDKVMDILNSRAEKYGQMGWVFQGAGKTGHLIEPKSGWKRILTRAGIKDLRLHDLRRTLGSWQAITGANSFMIGQSLGHKSSQATAVYARLNIDPVRESVEKATNAMLKHSNN
jgi:integrase